MIFKAILKDNSIFFDDPAKVREWLKELAKDGKRRIIVKIEYERQKRSLSQNRLYWLDCQTVADMTGYTAEEIHLINKCEYFGVKTIQTRHGEITVPAGSTTELDTKQFTAYIEDRRHRWRDEFPQLEFVDPDNPPVEAYYEEVTWSR